MKKYILVGVATIAVLGLVCWGINEQWKRDCAQAKSTVDCMHEIVGIFEKLS